MTIDADRWEYILQDMRRIRLLSPDMWRCGTMDAETVKQVWEEELSQSEKDWIVKHYAAWEHAVDAPMGHVRWRAALRPHVERARVWDASAPRE
ncbi:MAG TPA: hypothetical protein VIE68_06070 [Gemmatimonadota bacterium]|jgi:hypothetical protein